MDYKTDFGVWMEDLLKFTINEGYNLNNIMPVTKEEIIKFLKEDENLNNIDIYKWDRLAIYIKPIIIKYNQQKRGLSVWSLSDCVCLAKEWAKTEYIKEVV